MDGQTGGESSEFNRDSYELIKRIKGILPFNHEDLSALLTR